MQQKILSRSQIPSKIYFFDNFHPLILTPLPKEQKKLNMLFTELVYYPPCPSVCGSVALNGGVPKWKMRVT